jgi:hypothetical protein
MNSAIALWLFFRALRWLSWIAFFAYGAHYLAYKQDHINSFGHLLPSTEFWMFGLGLAIVFMGFFELMTRERAGVVRPRPGELIPPKAPAK